MQIRDLALFFFLLFQFLPGEEEWEGEDAIPWQYPLLREHTDA